MSGRASFGAGSARTDLEQRLITCEQMFAAAAAPVAGAIRPVTAALLHGSVIDMQSVISGERWAQRCNAAARACQNVLITQAPVGRDLRRLLATVRCAGHVRRAGLLLAQVARAQRWIAPGSMPPELAAAVEALAESSAQVFQGGLDAWESRDSQAVNPLRLHAEQVARQHRGLLEAVPQHAGSVGNAITLGLVGRHYQQIADRGVAIAAEGAWAVTGGVGAAR